jgi:hypothetical protein
MYVNVQHGSGITPYYTTIIDSTANVCNFLAGNDKNLVAKWMMDSIRDSSPPGFFHRCPYDTFKAFNVTIVSNAFLSQFIPGRYKLLVRFFDDLDENIITMFIEFEL